MEDSAIKQIRVLKGDQVQAGHWDRGRDVRSVLDTVSMGCL